MVDVRNVWNHVQYIVNHHDVYCRPVISSSVATPCGPRSDTHGYHFGHFNGSCWRLMSLIYSLFVVLPYWCE